MNNAIPQACVATKFLGGPNLPEPARWILWIIIIAGVIWFVFWAFGVPLP